MSGSPAEFSGDTLRLLAVCLAATLGVTALMAAKRKIDHYLDPSSELGPFEAWLCPPPPYPGAAVVVTGAESGLAGAFIHRALEAGWHVFAGVHVVSTDFLGSLPYDLPEHAKNRLVVCGLDVRSDTDVDGLREKIQTTVTSDGVPAQLFACVCNANSNTQPGPLEFVDPDNGLENSFAVGVKGSLRVVRSLLPLLRATPGARVVLVSSGAGQLAADYHGAYAMNKFAMEAMGDVLRRELAPEIAVTLVQLATIVTPTCVSWPDALDASLASQERYAFKTEVIVKAHQARVNEGITAEAAARAYAHASCFSGWLDRGDKPQDAPSYLPARYRVGLGVGFNVIATFLPSKIADQVLYMYQAFEAGLFMQYYRGKR